MGTNGSATSYEAVRAQRLEENKRRMEELGLVSLAKSLKNSSGASRVVRPWKHRPYPEERRRSSRVAANQAVEYNEQLESSPGVRRKYNVRGNRERREVSGRARRDATEAADLINENLEKPSFVKAMRQSDMWSCSLRMPNRFCKDHLPDEDGRIVLEDAAEKEWETAFLGHQPVLSRGWKGFVQDHELEDGDVCVFELLSKDRLKVHIVRASKPESRDADESESASEDTSRKATPEAPSTRNRRRSEMAKIGSQNGNFVNGQVVIVGETGSGDDDDDTKENATDNEDDIWEPRSTSEQEIDEEESDDEDDMTWKPRRAN